MIGRWCAFAPTGLLSLRTRVCHPSTRIYVRLLGPCFKTGGIGPICQRPETLSLGPRQGTSNELNSPRAYLLATDFPRHEPTLTSPRHTDAPRGAPKPRGHIHSIPFPFGNFKPFSHPFRGSFHLSFTVLVRYRSLTDI